MLTCVPLFIGRIFADAELTGAIVVFVRRNKKRNPSVVISAVGSVIVIAVVFGVAMLYDS